MSPFLPFLPSSSSSMFSFLLLLLPLLSPAEAAMPPRELSPGFYASTCPQAERIVRRVMRRAMWREPRSAASVMRLQFHDCFVNGCDGSVLLDDTTTMPGEKLALSNINSLRSFEVIDEAKAALERACPGVVSCADIVVIAARDAVSLSGGPDWKVKLGRVDSLWASQEDANKIMPSPRANATSLIQLFRGFNLSIVDLVALSGSHSIGDGRCFSVNFRLHHQYSPGSRIPDMDPAFRRRLERLCPDDGDGNVTAGLDATPLLFDNRYFKDLVGLRGFLNSDETLFSGDRQTREVVERFSVDQTGFFSAFVEGMVRMGDLQSDLPGEVRSNCRVVNAHPRPHSQLRFSLLAA